MATNKSQSVSKLLASIEVALSADTLTDASKESLLEQIRAYSQKPVKSASGKTGLLKLAGYDKHLIPFWEQYEQRDKLGVIHRQGRPGWKLIKDSILTASPCFCCLKPLSFGKLAIVHPRDGYRLAHYGCFLNWDNRRAWTRPITIAQVITDCAVAARISVENAVQSLYVAPVYSRCSICLMGAEYCGRVHFNQGWKDAIAAAVECANSVAETMADISRSFGPSFARAPQSRIRRAA